MKKFILLTALSLSTIIMAAQNLKPVPGNVNIDKIPTGVGIIEISGDWKVNRTCTQMASLLHNGHVIKQVPASNIPDVYCAIDGKIADHGTAVIEFFKDQDSEASEFGRFTVRIPEGFLINNADGTSSPNIEEDYTIKKLKIKISPVTSGSLEKIEKISLIFPKDTKVTCNRDNLPFIVTAIDNDKELLDDRGTNNNKIEPVDIKCEENTAELCFKPAITAPGRATLEIPKGIFEIATSVPGLEGTYKSPELSGSYYIYKASSSYSIFPADGIFEGGIQSLTVLEMNELMEQADSSIKKCPAGDVVDPANNFCYFLITNRPDDPPFTTLRQIEFCQVLEDGSLKKICALGCQNLGRHTIAVMDAGYTKGEGNYLKQTQLTVPPGRYTVHVPGNRLMTVTDSGIVGNQEFSIGEFTVNLPDERGYSVEPDPESELSLLSEIKLEYTEGSCLEWKKGTYASLSNGTVTYMLEGIVENNTIIFKMPAPLTLTGKWHFNTEIGSLTVNDVSVLAIEEFDINSNGESGINEISSCDTPVIYSISGVRIPLYDLSKLIPGIYILNGKKIIIR